MSKPSELEEAESSEDEPKKVTRTRVIKYASKVGRMRIEESVRRSTGSKHYEVEVTKENRVKAFADAGADICIMSKKKATELSLGMKKTKMTIHPYGSNKMKCCGYNVVAIMYGDKVANVGMYIINKNVETLLSGHAAEELGIITFNADSQETGDIRNINTENDPYKAKVIAKHSRIFKGVGILRDYRLQSDQTNQHSHHQSGRYQSKASWKQSLL